MKRFNKETKKNYNKKTRYSGVPYPYIVVEDKSEIKNHYDLYRNITANQENIWLDFAQYHIFRHELVNNLPLEEQLALYLIGVEDGTKKKIIMDLVKNNYNPLMDKIPFPNLSPEIATFLERKKETLLSVKKLIHQNLIIEKNVFIITISKVPKDILEILYYIGINIIIDMYEENCVIYINNIEPKIYEIKGKIINIKNTYNILKEYNPNWKLEKNILYNNKNKDSVDDILDIIKTNIL